MPICDDCGDDDAVADEEVSVCTREDLPEPMSPPFYPVHHNSSISISSRHKSSRISSLSDSAAASFSRYAPRAASRDFCVCTFLTKPMPLAGNARNLGKLSESEKERESKGESFTVSEVLGHLLPIAAKLCASGRESLRRRQMVREGSNQTLTLVWVPAMKGKKIEEIFLKMLSLQSKATQGLAVMLGRIKIVL